MSGGEPIALTSRKGADQSPAVSPDGRLIAYVGADDDGRADKDTQLSIMNIDGAGKHVITARFDRAVNNPIWASDGRSIYVQYDEHGSNRVARVNLDGSIHDIATGLTGSGLDRPYSGGEFSVSRNGIVALTAGDNLHPSDIAVASGGAVRRLTHLNQQLETKVLGQPQKLAITSSYDHRPIDAWMITPPDFDSSKKYPLILEIHGGPWAAYGPSFSSDDQLYAAAGYVVVYANPRGSTSYGQQFDSLIEQDYPSADFSDLMRA